MLRRLLRDSEALKALSEKLGLFRDPEVLEKYVIASEVTAEVLDLFLARIFGTERASMGDGSGDAKTICETLCGFLGAQKGAGGEESAAQAKESDREAEELRVKVQDLERQFVALQRQLQIQGDVTQLAESLDGRLSEMERRVSDLRSEVASVAENVVHLNKEVSARASNGDVRRLSKEVARLKEDERSLGEALEDRISDVEKKVDETKHLLKDEVQSEIMWLVAAVRMLPIDPLNGIIAQLTRECGGNVHDQKVVEVTSKGVWDDWHAPKRVVDLETNDCFWSKNEPNSWICYDFKGKRVAPTSYSIKPHKGVGQPRSWVFEVSNDGHEGSWQVVDRHENSSDLESELVVRNFEIARPSGSFRFICLRQTGKNYAGHDCLLLAALEVFGVCSDQ